MGIYRLQQGRNRRAHPSMTSDGENFNPSAESAIIYIRTAVECLLQHPTALGKYTIESLLKKVKSENLPTSMDKAVMALRNNLLFKARESLIRNFTIVLLTKVLKETSDYKERLIISSVLN